jgi:hypothetical protein
MTEHHLKIFYCLYNRRPLFFLYLFTLTLGHIKAKLYKAALLQTDVTRILFYKNLTKITHKLQHTILLLITPCNLESKMNQINMFLRPVIISKTMTQLSRPDFHLILLANIGMHSGKLKDRYL